MRVTHTLSRDGLPSIQYRRAKDSASCILRLEHRELKPEGTPHDDRFYPVNDGSLLWLQWQDGGREIIDALVEEQRAEEEAVGRQGRLIGALTRLHEAHEQALRGIDVHSKEWVVERLQQAVDGLRELFPDESVRALNAAHDPHGNLIIPL